MPSAKLLGAVLEEPFDSGSAESEGAKPDDDETDGDELEDSWWQAEPGKIQFEVPLVLRKHIGRGCG